MLCVPVFIFTPGSSALLGRPRCGLSIWLSLLSYSTHFSEFMPFFYEKPDEVRKYSKSTIFVWYENYGRRRSLGSQSINTERKLLYGLFYFPLARYSFMVIKSYGRKINKALKFVWFFSLLCSNKICKNMNSVQQGREHHRPLESRRREFSFEWWHI